MHRVTAWSTVAVVTAVVVAFVALLRMDSCADAALGEGESVCTSGPAVGVPLLWWIVVVGTAVVAVAIWNAVRAFRAASR